MNSDEFLKLVEEHPLPWHVQMPEEIAVVGSKHKREPLVPLDLVGHLRIAAPAMAARIIEFLAANDAVKRFVDGEAGRLPFERYNKAVAALRDSLPEALRQ